MSLWLVITFTAIVTIPASLTNCTWSINMSTWSITIWRTLKRTVFAIFTNFASFERQETYNKEIMWCVKWHFIFKWCCKLPTEVTVCSNKTVLASVRTRPTYIVTWFIVYTVTTAEFFTSHPKVTGSTIWFQLNTYHQQRVVHVT